MTKADHYELYRRMWLSRLFDETLLDFKKKARLKRGNLYASIGQEAINAGTSLPLQPHDYISPIHRDMPIFHFKGMSLESIMCQVWGKAEAPTRGKDSWSHMGDLNVGVIHSTSMLGSTIPVACGVAWALKLDGKTDSCVVAYTGEGATAQGVFHEGMNFAAVHKLPLVLIVENNQYAYSTPTHLGYATENTAARALGYGIPGWSIDGNDVLEVYEHTSLALARARAGEGPSIVECMTYRVRGHADHDDTRAMAYRPVEEIERGRKNDPIPRYRDYLIKSKMFKASELPSPPPDVQKQVLDAAEYAINAPEPEAHTAMEDIYDESAGVTKWSK